MNPSFRGVLFDLDGTLHDRVATLKQCLPGHTKRFDLPAGYAARFTVLGDFSQHLLSGPAPMPGAHEVLAELRRRGLKLGVVTNGRTQMQSSVMERLALRPLVDDLLISEAAGLAKPDPACYALALARLGLSAGETLFVGDSPRNDVLGPQLAGMRAAHLPSSHPLSPDIVPDFALRTLRELLPIMNNP